MCVDRKVECLLVKDNIEFLILRAPSHMCWDYRYLPL